MNHSGIVCLNELQQKIHVQVQKKQCHFLQKTIRQNALREEKRRESSEFPQNSDEDDIDEVFSDRVQRLRRAKR